MAGIGKDPPNAPTATAPAEPFNTARRLSFAFRSMSFTFLTAMLSSRSFGFTALTGYCILGACQDPLENYLGQMEPTPCRLPHAEKENRSHAA
jgi:hypothetical protein